MFSWLFAGSHRLQAIVSTSEKCFFIHLIAFLSNIFYIMKLICISFKSMEKDHVVILLSIYCNHKVGHCKLYLGAFCLMCITNYAAIYKQKYFHSVKFVFFVVFLFFIFFVFGKMFSIRVSVYCSTAIQQLNDINGDNSFHNKQLTHYAADGWPTNEAS